MVNKLSERHCCDSVEDYKKYTIQCPCCGTMLNFSKDDVYRDEDDFCIHHEYIDCPACNEAIRLSDDKYYG